MKVHHHHEVTYIELDQPELMIHWGGHKKRMRVRPDSLMVKWDKRPDDDWFLNHVFLLVRSTRKGCEHEIRGITLYERHVWNVETPDWVRDLVDQSHPVPEWQRVSHAMGVS